MSDPEIHEWEVWHTYATYLRVSKVNLDFLARRLVESGVALCAMLRDGRTYWSSGSTIGSGTTHVDLDAYGTHAKLSLKRDPGHEVSLDGFAAEAWQQAGHFRFNEQRVFGEDGALPPAYVRAFLGQCNLISEADPKSTIRLYPVLLIYESGVVLLELRTIAPSSPTPLSHFISGAVNLFQHPFERIEVPPGLVRLATKAYYHSYRNWTLPYRAALLWLERGHDRAVRQLTRFQKEGDFAFNLAPLSGAKDAGRREKLSTFALTLFHSVAFLLASPRSSVGFLLRGRDMRPNWGASGLVAHTCTLPGSRGNVTQHQKTNAATERPSVAYWAALSAPTQNPRDNIYQRTFGRLMTTTLILLLQPRCGCGQTRESRVSESGQIRIEGT